MSSEPEVPAYRQDLARRHVSTLLWRKWLDAGDLSLEAIHGAKCLDRFVGC